MSENVQQVPSVGRVVHYTAYGTPNGEFPAGVQRAAIITEVDTPGDPTSTVGLCVLNPTGMFFNQHIRYEPGRPGCWGWPAFVPPVIRTSGVAAGLLPGGPTPSAA